MMEGVVIRKALREDCPAILELVRELALYEKAPHEVTVSLGEMEEAGFGPQPVWWALVAESGPEKRLVGLSLYYIRYSTWKGRRLYLEDIIVNEAYRGKGIGKALFEATAREAKDLGLCGMTWQVLEWNQPAIQFYLRYGASADKEWWNMALEKEQLARF